MSEETHLEDLEEKATPTRPISPAESDPNSSDDPPAATAPDLPDPTEDDAPTPNSGEELPLPSASDSGGLPPALSGPLPPAFRRQATAKRNLASPPPERWAVIAVFSLVAFLQGGSYATFALAPALSIRLLPLSTSLEDWTLNCNNIAQAAFIPLAIYLLRRRPIGPGGQCPSTGLRVISVFAVMAQLLQSVLWTCAVLVPNHFPSLVNVLLLAGGCAGGICTGCVQGACTRLSAVWFPPMERGSATGCVYAALFFGQAAATFASLFFCSSHQHGLDVRDFVYWQLAASVLLAALILGWFPDRPRDRPAQIDPADFASTNEEPLLPQSPNSSTPPASDGGGCTSGAGKGELPAHEGASHVSTGLIILAVAWATGGYQAYQQVLPLAFENQGGDAVPACNSSVVERLSTREGDLFALVSAVTYAAGGPAAGAIADRFFVRRLKRLMLLAFLFLALNFGFILFTMPPPPWFVGDDGGLSFGPGGEGLSLFAVALSGLLAGMTTVPALELLGEGQVLSEGTSANLVMLGIQIFAIAMTYLNNIFATPGLDVLMCVSVFCCFVIGCFVREHYGRLDDCNRRSETATARETPACSSQLESFP